MDDIKRMQDAPAVQPRRGLCLWSENPSQAGKNTPYDPAVYDLPMDYSLAFLQSVHFYYLLLIGCAAMIPRARYIADKAAAISSTAAAEIKPSIAQRACLFIPGICVFASILLLRNPVAAGVLLVSYIAVYIVMILFFRGPRAQ